MEKDWIAALKEKAEQKYGISLSKPAQVIIYRFDYDDQGRLTQVQMSESGSEEETGAIKTVAERQYKKAENGTVEISGYGDIEDIREPIYIPDDITECSISVGVEELPQFSGSKPFVGEGPDRPKNPSRYEFKYDSEGRCIEETNFHEAEMYAFEYYTDGKPAYSEKHEADYAYRYNENGDIKEVFSVGRFGEVALNSIFLYSGETLVERKEYVYYVAENGNN